ncbi:MAG: segregation/condensation protein A [Candidatus Pacearchaeota archaeon]
MKKEDKINQNQFFDLITSNELSWQSIIYDLIKTEQLDPWDINLTILADKYIETIKRLEDENFFISSKVLLACALILRLKSDILADDYIQELNDSLYGKKEIQSILNFTSFEEIDEENLPILILKTPLARHKKVTLDELMKALNHAINTENKRIKRQIKTFQTKKATLNLIPKKQVPLTIRIQKMYSVITQNILVSGRKLMKFQEIAYEKDQKLSLFLPLLHLANAQKIYLWQPVHFKDINISKEMHPEEQLKIKEELEFIEDL